MKIQNKIAALLASLALLTACSDDITSIFDGNADNAITLRAGISEGGTGVMTRAAGGYDDIDAANHAKHLPFTSGTKAALRIDGTWLGKAAGTYTKGSIIKGTIASGIVTQTTTATIQGETTTGSKHNAIEFSSDEQLYWDDYGSADPNNMSTAKGGLVSDGTDGRSKGLTVYGAAVNGEATAPVIDGTTGKEWSGLTWMLNADQKTNNWSTKDLLISKNVKVGGPDDTYKFDERDAGKLLEFTHAMSKITVRLIASDGFPTTGVGATTNKFASAPEVKLTSNETGQSNAEWANTVCTINVTDGTYNNSSTPAIITMHTAKTDDSQYTVIYDALVAPGSVFGAPTGDPATYPIIARINADGNIYYVTAKEIRAKIAELITASKHNNEYKTESGKNYIITVNVKKTKIEVTATIKDWEDVESAPIYPVINVNASYGSNENNFSKENFSFYRSTTLNNNYSKDFSNNANGYFAAEATVTKSGDVWNFSTPLYWPDHSTHYQMRGVWPLTGTGTGDVNYPRVETKNINSQDYQVISVKNVAYESGTFPSDLAIARPDVATNATCNNSDHTAKILYSDGICATEGKINLAFEYMMSQVEVSLTTTTGTDAVTLSKAKVEVTNLYTTGDVKLGDRETVVSGSTSDYTLNTVAGDGNENKRLDAIVPQTLTYTTPGVATNVRFKITIYKNGDPEQGIDDIYYADVNPILEKDKDTKIAPNGKWESGKHYVYNLKLSKTKIDVTATFKDWVTVTADEDIWF